MFIGKSGLIQSQSVGLFVCFLFCFHTNCQGKGKTAVFPLAFLESPEHFLFSHILLTPVDLGLHLGSNKNFQETP